MRVSFEPHPDLDLNLAEIVPHPRSERDPKTKRARRFEVRSLLWAGAARADLYPTRIQLVSNHGTRRSLRCPCHLTSHRRLVRIGLDSLQIPPPTHQGSISIRYDCGTLTKIYG